MIKDSCGIRWPTILPNAIRIYNKIFNWEKSWECGCLTRISVLDCNMSKDEQLKVVNLTKLENLITHKNANMDIQNTKEKLTKKQRLYFKLGRQKK